MSFESDYTDLIKIAKSIIKSRGLYINPLDVASAVYLHFADNNIGYNKEIGVKQIHKEITKERATDGQYVSELFTGRLNILDIDKLCTKCKIVKPIGAFHYYYKREINAHVHNSWCIDCLNQHRIDGRKEGKYNYYKRVGIKKSGGSRKRLTDEQRNNIYKLFRKKQKELLTDYYIKSVIRGSLHCSTKTITPEMIIERRVQILAKRSNKKSGVISSAPNHNNL